MTQQVISDVERAAPSETPSAAEAAAGMRTFAHRLLSEHPELLKDGNGVVSAASIGTAFAMLRAGAAGETADQIDRVLKFPSSDLGGAYNFLTDRWQPGAGDDVPEVSVANSLFVRDGYALLDPFLDALARDFGAGVRTVDFTGDDAVEVINAWVREQTRDRIDKLFDEFREDTRLVIANAIYLKAAWVHRFAAYSTRDREFRRASGGPVEVPFMHQTVRIEYVEHDGWSAVRLPYRGKVLSMWVLLPDGSGDPVELLDPRSLAHATQLASTRSVELSLPKWDFRTERSLATVLRAMGMPRAFTDRAEFPGVSTERLKVDQVRHHADITVDEDGTEAAAATGISMVPVSAVVHRDVTTFHADHPFAFVVLHDATGAPLFEGVVGDPSATR